MLPYHFLQNHGSDEVGFTVCLVLVVNRALEEILPLFKILCGAVVHLLTAVSAVHQTGEQACLSCLGSSVSLLPDLFGVALAVCAAALSHLIYKSASLQEDADLTI